MFGIVCSMNSRLVLNIHPTRSTNTPTNVPTRDIPGAEYWSRFKICVPPQTDRRFEEGMTSLGAPSQEVYDYTSVRGTFMALGSVLLRG